MTTTRPEAAPAVATAALDARGVHFRYGQAAALAGLDLAVGVGRLTALIGPNGSGKTTFLRLVCGLLRMQEGQVQMLGEDLRRARPHLRHRLGVVFQQSTLDAELTVAENLLLHGRLHGLARRAARARTERRLADFGLSDLSRRRVSTLSGGQARRVELARVLLHEPSLLILDEATTGLDPTSRAVFWSDVRGLVRDGGVTVLFSTHYLDEAAVADEAALVVAGRCVATGSPDDLRREVAAGRVTMTTDQPYVLRRLAQEAGCSRVSVDHGTVVAGHGDPCTAAAQLLRLAALSGVHVSSVETHPLSLEDVFAALTARDGA